MRVRDGITGISIGASLMVAVSGLTPVPATGAVATAPQHAGSAMRDPRYRGVKRVLVLSLYGPGGEVAGGEASDALCAEFVALARRDAPVPVECSEAGDPRLVDGTSLVVILQASVSTEPAGTGQLFALSARAQFAGGLEPAPQYFGAAPLVVRFAETAAGRADRARAIGAALDEVLPWRRSGGDRVRHRLSRE